MNCRMTLDSRPGDYLLGSSDAEHQRLPSTKGLGEFVGRAYRRAGIDWHRSRKATAVVRRQAEKDLTWAHVGCSYRSQVVIRLNGRRRTEAFLHVLDDTGRWQPVRLDDGTVSDGKVETYTRCVEAICGSADTFFMSVFDRVVPPLLLLRCRVNERMHEAY